MQRDPVEVVASIYATWNAGEWGLEYFHSDVEWEFTGAGTLDESGASRGRDALLAYWRRFWDAWRPGARWEIEELQRKGDDRVLACGQLNVVGRSSGLQTTIPVFHLWRVGEGIIMRLVICEDRASALQAADG
jgi:ketosteroid isomerase-like protein